MINEHYYNSLDDAKLKELADNNDPVACYFYAMRIIGDNFTDAMPYMFAAASKEVLPAMEWVSNYLIKNIDQFDLEDPKDLKTVKDLIEIILTYVDHCPAAALCIGIMYLNGDGVEKDVYKAISYFESAANRGEARAYNLLGVLSLNGPDDYKDPKRAIAYFEKAASLDLPVAYYNLGYVHSKGIGTEKDEKKAFMFYFRAANKGYTAAFPDLIRCYLEGIGVDVNYNEAIRWAKKAYELGSEETIITVGSIFEDKNEYQLAFECYIYASMHNNAEGHFNVGYFYSCGYYVEKNYKTAVKYYQFAIDLKHAVAMNNAAHLYEDGGYGLEKDIDKAIELYKMAVALGNETAMINLGLLYEELDNREEAFKYFQIAANYQNTKGQFYVAVYYDNGFLGEPNYKLAFEYYQLAAEKGHPSACNNLAYMYENGNDYVEKDIDKAIYYYTKGVEAGNSTSMVNLGILYYDGLSVEENLELAFKYFKMAADNDNETGQFYVGLFYDRGIYVKQDYEKAIYYYSLAAEKGHKTSLNNLGYAYEYGHGVPIDLDKAIYYYEKAANLGVDVAMTNLASVYANNDYPDYQDYNKAFYWYQKAAELGSSSGMFNLGYMYDMGNGVTQSYEKAKYWYEKAAEAGSPNAHNNLGFMYQYGYGVEKNINKAIEYYQKAAELGSSVAMINLGEIYYDADDVEQNYEEAFYWFKKAADKEYPKGEFYIGLFYDRGYGVEEDKAAAVKWYQRAVDHGNISSAMNNLAYCYTNGLGIKKDVQKAIYWYEKAIELGNTTSMYNLAYIYYGEEGYIDYQTALYYAQMAYDKDYESAQELISKINDKINELSDDHVDPSNFKNVFISWNHNDAALKDKIIHLVENSGFSVWKSNVDCIGDIQESCKKGVKGSEISIFLMTDHYFESEWMNKELRWSYEKFLEREGFVIPIWIGEKINERRNNPAGMPEEFIWLSKLGGIFGVDEIKTSLIERVSRAVSLKRMLDYQDDLKVKSSTYTMFLSNFVHKEGDNSIDFKHNINEDFYISRTLYDKDEKPYKESDVINSKQHILIVGGGGMGKSLYLQKLICTFQNDDNYFFRFNIKEVASYFKVSPDKSFRDFLLMKVNASSDIPSSSLGDSNSLFAFDNVKKRYILIDALDEFIKGDNVDLDFVLRKLALFASKKDTHYIFTARSDVFEREIETCGYGNVLPLYIKELTDEEATRFVSNIYNDFYINNFVRASKVTKEIKNTDEEQEPLKFGGFVLDMGRSASFLKNGDLGLPSKGSLLKGDAGTEQGSGETSTNVVKSSETTILKPEVVIESLKYLNDEIKRNPLLLSNFIILVMREKRIPEKKVDVIDKSSRILFNDLEKARDATHDQIDRELLNNSEYFLEYIAYYRSRNNTKTVQELLADAIRENDLIDDKYILRAGDLYNFYKSRAIIVGGSNDGNVYHEIFKTYFTCKYIYRNVYYEDNEDGLSFIYGNEKKGKNRLIRLTKSVFSDNRPWIEVIPLIFTYLDYRAYQIGADDMGDTYDTILETKDIVFSEGRNSYAKQEVLDLIEARSLYNIEWFINIFL